MLLALCESLAAVLAALEHCLSSHHVGLAPADGVAAALADLGATMPASATPSGTQMRPKLGVRPSDFEDASLADASWPRMRVHADVTEKLGSEIHIIFTLDTPPVQHPSISQTVTEEGKRIPRRYWLAASRCGPYGSPHAAGCNRASPSSWL